MTDIVSLPTMLRARIGAHWLKKEDERAFWQAADEIERLEADNARLRAALREIRDEIIYGGGDMIEEPDIDKLHDIARGALDGKDD